jgi:hypothetical protein
MLTALPAAGIPFWLTYATCGSTGPATSARVRDSPKSSIFRTAGGVGTQARISSFQKYPCVQ